MDDFRVSTVRRNVQIVAIALAISAFLLLAWSILATTWDVPTKLMILAILLLCVAIIASVFADVSTWGAKEAT